MDLVNCTSYWWNPSNSLVVVELTIDSRLKWFHLIGSHVIEEFVPIEPMDKDKHIGCYKILDILNSTDTRKPYKVTKHFVKWEKFKLICFYKDHLKNVQVTNVFISLWVTTLCLYTQCARNVNSRRHSVMQTIRFEIYLSSDFGFYSQ